MATSTASVVVPSLGYTYTFDGVTSISHALSLRVSTDGSTSDESDWVNNAKNEPDVVTLSVIASDTAVPITGWATQTLRSMAQIKEKRLICQVVTPVRVYNNMLLTSLTALQDDTSTDAWTGTLTFTQIVATKAASTSPAATTTTARAKSNSSKAKSSAKSATKNVSSRAGSVLKSMLKRSGINYKN